MQGGWVPTKDGGTGEERREKRKDSEVKVVRY
jgi:hypothetical protein